MTATHLFKGRPCWVEERSRPWYYKGRAGWRKVYIVHFTDTKGGTQNTTRKTFEEQAYHLKVEQPEAAAALQRMKKLAERARRSQAAGGSGEAAGN